MHADTHVQVNICQSNSTTACVRCSVYHQQAAKLSHWFVLDRWLPVTSPPGRCSGTSSIRNRRCCQITLVQSEEASCVLCCKKQLRTHRCAVHPCYLRCLLTAFHMGHVQLTPAANAPHGACSPFASGAGPWFTLVSPLPLLLPVSMCHH